MKTIFFLFTFLISLAAHAEVVIYKTYQVYKDDKGEKYDDYHGFQHTKGNVILSFLKDDKKTKIACKDMWGFKYNDILFRTDVKNNQPVRVVVVGKICYYENGIAHLGMIRDKKDEGSFTIGNFCYLSKDLNSELLPMPKAMIMESKKEVNKFKAGNPQYKELFDCIEKNYTYQHVRTCVDEFEEER